jgi:hypothetical protein
MNIPSFHDGRFDGFWISADDAVHLFLRTQKGERFTLILRGVERLNLSEIREGNIILDLVFRDAEGLTISDMEELYRVAPGSPQAATFLKQARERKFKALEINPSYGALALFLFQTSEIRETDLDP